MSLQKAAKVTHMAACMVLYPFDLRLPEASAKAFTSPAA
jgi:hypothetical protein